MAKNIEKINLFSVIDHWDLNIIPEDMMSIEKTIASGGQGKVKLGKYYNMSIIVKVLHNLNTRDYTNEVKNVYKYRHPNIPKFLGIFQSEKNYGLISEHVDGKTLSKLIQMERQGTKIAFVQKINYLIQLASIIDFLHDHKLIHRDLKPDNIIVDHLGNLKLLDYGIAIHEDNSFIALNSPEFALTPTYIPPEVLMQTQKSDDEEEDEDDESGGSSNTSQNNINKNQYASNGSNGSTTKNNNMFNMTSSKNSFYSMGNTKSSNMRPVSAIQNMSNMLNTNMSFTKFGQTQKMNMADYVFVTNKFDIWTFGLILSELMTRCRPWAKNEKDSISEFNISAYITRKLPYFIGKLTSVPVEHQETITKLIKTCTLYEPEQRMNIKEIKEILIKIFNKDVNEEKKLRNIKDLKNLSKINAEIKKSLDENNVANTNSVIRNGKIIQRTNVANKLQLINAKNNISNKNDSNNTNNEDSISKLNNLILSSVNAKSKAIDNKKDKDLPENGLMTNLRKIHLNKENKLLILNKKIKEIDEKMNKLAQTDTKSFSVEVSNCFKNYNFMTYDDINSNILIYELPRREIILEKGIMRKLYKDLIKYRNPFCLNYDEKLFLIGGMANNIYQQDTETGSSNDNNGLTLSKQKSSESLNLYLLNNTNHALYSELFGLNYAPTNMCIYYDPKNKELKLLPILLYARCCSSAIIFKRQIYVVGGNSNFCEVLDLNINKTKSAWFTINELKYSMYDPLLLNYNDNLIFAIQISNKNSNKSIDYGHKIDIQIMNLKSDNKWSDESINLNFNKPEFLDFTYFNGIYYCNNGEDDNKLYLFGNCKKKNDDINNNIEDNNNITESEVIVPFVFTFKIESYKKSENDSDNSGEESNNGSVISEFEESYKLNLENCTEIKFNNTIGVNNNNNTIFKNELFIHNTNTFYCYDENLIYYTYNREKKIIEPKSLDMPLNNIY